MRILYLLLLIGLSLLIGIGGLLIYALPNTPAPGWLMILVGVLCLYFASVGARRRRDEPHSRRTTPPLRRLADDTAFEAERRQHGVLDSSLNVFNDDGMPTFDESRQAHRD